MITSTDHTDNSTYAPTSGGSSMNKLITKTELSEVTLALINKPSITGHLDTFEQHQAFLKDIAEVVASHCGGSIEAVTTNGEIEIAPNDSLPSLHNNIWETFDCDKWINLDANSFNIEAGSPTEPHIHERKRVEMRSSATPSAQERFEYNHTMVDWRAAEGSPLDAEGDDKTYRATCRISNQPSIEVSEETDEGLTMGICVEINKGIPMVNIDLGDDVLLTIGAAHGGLVITPMLTYGKFESAPVDRYTYSTSNALFIE
ncbi:hypothetical protein AB4254_08050 [Vibrio breoganii]